MINCFKKEKNNWFGVVTKSFFALTFFVLFFSFASPARAATYTTTATGGNWNVTGTWAGGVVPPLATDDVVIANGATLTTNVNKTINSISYTVNGSGNLVVNTGIVLTVTTSITAPGLKTTGTYTISGAGTINCATLNVNNNTTPTGNPNNTVTVTSTITALNISGNLVLTGAHNGVNKGNDPIFSLQSGTTTVGGTVQTINANASNVSTILMNGGAQTGTLILSGATPWTLSGTGTNTITLNGTGSTVIYNYNGNQTVLGTAYRNLQFATNGIKSIVTGTSVAGNLSISPTGSTTASVGNGLNISVNSLTLGGNLKVSGTWGSTASAAIHTDNVYFQATTGILTITTGSADATSPTVSIVAIQSLTTVNVTFSEAMGSGVTTAGNYTISESGQGTLAVNPNTVTLVSGNTYKLTWSSGSMVNAADITITVANAQDLAGNVVTTPNSGRSQIRGVIHFGTKVNTFLNGVKQYFYFH